MTLLDDLRAAGLTVRGEGGWATRTQSATTREGKKVTDRPYTTSLVWHWDAIRSSPANSYYISGNRYGGLIYHIVVRRDGTLDLLGQRIAWNAGSNYSGAHDELLAGRTPPPRPSKADDMSGNPYTFSLCANYHPDYEPLSPAAYSSMVKASAVLLPHLGLQVTQLVDHATLTSRKSDMSWGNRVPGGKVDMNQARADVDAILHPIPPPDPELPDPPLPPVQPTRRYMYPLTSPWHLCETLTEPELFGYIDAGVVQLIDGDVAKTKAYWGEVLARRNPTDVDWSNLTAALTRAHFNRVGKPFLPGGE